MNKQETAEADQAHDDQELAKQIVALGVGKLFGGLHGQTGRYYTDSKIKQERTGYLMPELFVRDWRVAGALMEKCHSVQCCGSKVTNDWEVRACCLPTGDHTSKTINESLPRAINEACVEALT